VALCHRLDKQNSVDYRSAMAQQVTLRKRLQTLLVEFLIGLALGVLVWELVGRRLLALKFGSLGSSVTCAPDVNQALTEFDSGLRISALVGAVAFVVLSLVVRIWWRRRGKRSENV
jgi:hypothetical protein